MAENIAAKEKGPFWDYRRLAETIRAQRRENDLLADECALINARRIYYSAIIAMCVHVVHILLFSFTPSQGDPVRRTWILGIIASHALLFVSMFVFRLVARRLRRLEQPTRPARAFQYIVASVLMAVGVAIVAIDQLVTTNITPFLVVCLISGGVFLFRPLHALLLYAAAYGRITSQSICRSSTRMCCCPTA